MQRKEEIVVDLKKVKYDFIRLKQFDKTILKFKVLDNSTNVNLTNADISIIFLKPNKKIIKQNSGTTIINALNGEFEITLLEDCIRDFGNAGIEVLLNLEGKFSTFIINVKIEKSNIEGVNSSNTPNYIEELEKKAEEIQKQVDDKLEEIEANYNTLKDDLQEAIDNYELIKETFENVLLLEDRVEALEASQIVQDGKIKILETNYTRKSTGGVDVNTIKENGVQSISTSANNLNLPPRSFGRNLGNSIWFKLGSTGVA